ncbi:MULTISPECIES: DUF5949 family protein [Streptomyces]|uniref:DUF5949 family protein n=1 Tax=Streptomyces TaxID=1883 RepID=UPI00081B8523|nr:MULTISPECIES: DUF5949 family protein [unclassified Streptomyces]MYQ53674.1 hypothetical protein [Streptomyces sp. SID4941]SCE10085.1 hypothetical protein GA0115247_123034 [Streptomyces sp. PalvLS-984]SDB93412.1 hypothetical protein F558DRAFT_00567 [Streptomyces sp. AmelKG-A3]
MTTPQTATGTFTQAQLGTQILLGWSGEHPSGDRDVAFLLTYSLGDGQDGPEAGERAMRTALERSGLRVGGETLDASESPNLPVKLLVQAGQAVLTLPHFTAQYTVPREWLAAARAGGTVHGMFATRPWPAAVPGQPVGEELLRSFVCDPEVVRTSAHCLLPVRSLG